MIEFEPCENCPSPMACRNVATCNGQKIVTGPALKVVQPNKQILVVLGGLTFISLPVKAEVAKSCLNSAQAAAPNATFQIVDEAK